MSNNLRQAAQAALESALDEWIETDPDMAERWITEKLAQLALKQRLKDRRAALAAPQPEPLTRDQIRDMVKECGLDWHRGFVPLFAGDDTNRYEVLVREAVERFAAPQASLKPLGYEQIVAIWQKHMKTRALPNYEDFARAIERAHGIGVKP